MVEKERSLPITSRDPAPVELFNSGSPEGKKPFRITLLMLEIEDKHNGTPIDAILRSLYWDQKKGPSQIGREVGRSKNTIYSWLIRLGIGTRSVKDGIDVWKTGREPGEMLAGRNNRTEVRLTDVQNKFKIESEEGLRKFLGEMYKQYHSLEAMAKALTEGGINVGSTIVKNWMSNSRLDRNVLLEEDNKNLVQKAFENGDFMRLTQRQQHILESRGYLGEEPLVPFRKLKEVQVGRVGRITFQSAFDTEVKALKRLRKQVHKRLIMAQARVSSRPVGRPKKSSSEVSPEQSNSRILETQRISQERNTF